MQKQALLKYLKGNLINHKFDLYNCGEKLSDNIIGNANIEKANTIIKRYNDTIKQIADITDKEPKDTMDFIVKNNDSVKTIKKVTKNNSKIKPTAYNDYLIKKSSGDNDNLNSLTRSKYNLLHKHGITKIRIKKPYSRTVIKLYGKDLKLLETYTKSDILQIFKNKPNVEVEDNSNTGKNVKKINIDENGNEFMWTPLNESRFSLNYELPDFMFTKEDFEDYEFGEYNNETLDYFKCEEEGKIKESSTSIIIKTSSKHKESDPLKNLDSDKTVIILFEGAESLFVIDDEKYKIGKNLFIYNSILDIVNKIKMMQFSAGTNNVKNIIISSISEIGKVLLSEEKRYKYEDYDVNTHASIKMFSLIDVINSTSNELNNKEFNFIYVGNYMDNTNILEGECLRLPSTEFYFSQSHTVDDIDGQECLHHKTGSKSPVLLFKNKIPYDFNYILEKTKWFSNMKPPEDSKSDSFVKGMCHQWDEHYAQKYLNQDTIL